MGSTAFQWEKDTETVVLSSINHMPTYGWLRLSALPCYQPQRTARTSVRHCGKPKIELFDKLHQRQKRQQKEHTGDVPI